MSMDYAIAIKLHTECNENNITAILEKGAQKGFRYYDEIGEMQENPNILDVRTTAKKIIKAQENKPELGPCVYTILDIATYENAFLWFQQSDDGYLMFRMAAFGCPKKKGYFIDFAYYIRLCLDLCEDFPVLELKTTMI